MTARPSTQGKDTAPTDTGGWVQVGHVYFDARNQRIHFLNETARRLHAGGLPFTSADTPAQPLTHLTGQPVEGKEMPLEVALREQGPVEASFLVHREVGPAWRIAWNVTPLFDNDALAGLMATVTCSPPEPDWRLLAELAHDLRNPLHSVSLLCTVLDAKLPPDEDLREGFGKLRGTAERAMAIGRDLLEWCRKPLSRGRPVQEDWFNLVPFLVTLADEQTPEAHRKGLVLKTSLTAADSWEVKSDRIRLGRLLSNLLNNAIRYTPRGRVEFTASWRGNGESPLLVLSVVDTGTGMKAEEQESVFEPFRRGRAAQDSDSSGSGLGLASVDNLVKELGLSLEIQSELNNGTAFHLLLPAQTLRQPSSQE